MSIFKIKTSDLYRDYYIKYNYCEKETNLSNSINFKKEFLDYKFVITRCSDILKRGFKDKLNNDLEKLVNWDIKPIKIDNNSTYAPIYSNYKENRSFKFLEPMCNNKILELEKIYSKRLGLQVFDFVVSCSKNFKIIPDHTNSEHRFYCGLYLEIIKFDTKLVYIE